MNLISPYLHKTRGASWLPEDQYGSLDRNKPWEVPEKASIRHLILFSPHGHQLRAQQVSSCKFLLDRCMDIGTISVTALQEDHHQAVSPKIAR